MRNVTQWGLYVLKELFSKTTQNSQTFFGIALLGASVYGNQTEGHGETLLPFKIIQKAPVTVALDGDPFCDAGLHASHGLPDEFRPAAIVRGCDAVFGNEKIPLKFLMDSTDYIGQSLGIELIAHLGQLGIFGSIQLAEETETAAAVVLDTQEIIFPDIRKIVTELCVPFLCGMVLAAPLRLHIMEG